MELAKERGAEGGFDDGGGRELDGVGEEGDGYLAAFVLGRERKKAKGDEGRRQAVGREGWRRKEKPVFALSRGRR